MRTTPNGLRVCADPCQVRSEDDYAQAIAFKRGGDSLGGKVEAQALRDAAKQASRALRSDT